MNLANYLNGKNKYPLSTQALDFIQEQIKLIYRITDLYGKNYILRLPDSSTDGLIVVNGELMPLRISSDSTIDAQYIKVEETQTDVNAIGEVYSGLRTYRAAYYTNTAEDNFVASNFQFVTKIEEVIRTLQSVSSVPVGCIMMWSGTINAIPNDYALCNGENGTPDLRDKFIVGAGSRYSVGDTGGEDSHLLTASESGVASHSHEYQYPIFDGTGFSAQHGSGEIVQTGTQAQYSNTGSHEAPAQKAHENRPPYYALAYIMKYK